MVRLGGRKENNQVGHHNAAAKTVKIQGTRFILRTDIPGYPLPIKRKVHPIVIHGLESEAFLSHKILLLMQ